MYILSGKMYISTGEMYISIWRPPDITSFHLKYTSHSLSGGARYIWRLPDKNNTSHQLKYTSSHLKYTSHSLSGGRQIYLAAAR